MKYNRVILLVLDSLGIGYAKDSKEYGDEGANTLGSISKVDGFSVPCLESLGVGKLREFDNISSNQTRGYALRANELSNGKDTTVGHFEFVGVHTKDPFPVFTENGFPKELISKIEELSGHKFIGNYASSGTVILDELGKEHMETKSLIIYTSNDSVLQIAAHEEIIPLEELYKVCEIAREVTMEAKWRVARIIARPFVGEEGNYKRTANRHDYSIQPPHKTTLNFLEDSNFEVVGVGKISDIYDGYGITRSVKTKSNMHGMDETIKLLDEDFSGLIFTNLVEFDSEYGHRRNVEGYANAVMEADKRIEELISKMKNDDLLIITADHGNDPGYKGTDHTREQIFVLTYAHNFNGCGILEEADTFADIGATISENFGVEKCSIGNSFLKDLK